MSFIELTANAKINLSLDVLRKREDGYHELKMIMQSVELSDTIFIEKIKKGISIECDKKWVPCDNRNIAYKAASLITSLYGINEGLKINIKKRIPVSAGLAGGSSDAAAVLKGVNQMFSLGLGKDKLMELGKQIGADVPYCIIGGTMLAEGIGEVLTPLEPLSNVHIVILKPKICVSTAWVYRSLDIDKIIDRPDTENLIKAIEKKDINTLATGMRNVLEYVTIPYYKVVQEAKDKLIELGAKGSMMSGSGSSVFGVFENKEDAQKAYMASKDMRWDSFLTYTL